MIVTGLFLGALLGIAFQRGRFCVTGFLRDMFTLRSSRGFVALMVVIAVHALGFAALSSAGVIEPTLPELAPVPVILGGILFGLGIVLAGGCASGTWYRSGEGLVGSWIALVMYGLSAAAAKSGILAPLSTELKSHTLPLTSIPESLGVSPWPFVVAFAAVTAYLVTRELTKENAQPVQPGSAAADNGQPTSTLRRLVSRPWHLYATALVVGVLGVVAWPLSAATGRNDSLGITTPSANLTRFLVTGDASRLDWGVLLVLGILLGSFLSARASGEFRVRVPDATQAGRSVIGGVFMGVGAAWAGGCTVGNGMVQTALWTYQGWLALAAITVGVFLATKLWLRPRSAQAPRVTRTQPAAPREVRVETSAAAPSPSLGFQVAPVGTLLAPQKEKAGVEAVEPGVHEIDMMGAVCPFPLIEAKEAITRIPVGDELRIRFDCTQGTDSIPRWAVGAGHTVTQLVATGEAAWVIGLRRNR
ncbi:YeeE/YedE family protein [Corynebacterium uropygiale]|uniref:YeeE/YedE family protein n=1 Tax=Corynebacterium uropygiale TaxID=1775911 RepID=A0A9X1TZM9_9CORY|nr:YeeE/YedE thiosulfate transporter family protein [Corynebacterium uropygiale]MCF4005884.1 YeeE/YedE family protein [Corynebacterium uropygiale]